MRFTKPTNKFVRCCLANSVGRRTASFATSVQTSCSYCLFIINNTYYSRRALSRLSMNLNLNPQAEVEHVELSNSKKNHKSCLCITALEIVLLCQSKAQTCPPPNRRSIVTSPSDRQSKCKLMEWPEWDDAAAPHSDEFLAHARTPHATHLC